MLSRYRQLDRDGRWYLLIYALCTVWPIPYALATPYQTTAVFAASLLLAWGVIITAAGASAIVGLFRRDNLILERYGLWTTRWLTLVFPFVSTVTLILEVLSQGYSQRWHATVLGIIPFVILSKRQQRLDEKAAHARETPLPEEA